MPTANQFISGVWFDRNKIITHVFLHKVLNEEKNLEKGVKHTVPAIVAFIENGGVVKTITWNYTKALWNIGAQIIVVHESGRKFLRTKGDSTVRDNLDNLINMEFFII